MRAFARARVGVGVWVCLVCVGVCLVLGVKGVTGHNVAAIVRQDRRGRHRQARRRSHLEIDEHCHSADALSPSLLRRRLKGEGGAAE